MSADYPKLVRPDILRQLNDEVFSILGLPIFLNTEPLPLYSLKESKYSFPALAAILYCIYHDYSRGLLDICVKKKHIPVRLQSDSALMAQRKRAEDHYKDICRRLRNGFYHGYYPEQELGIKFPAILGIYTGADFSPDNSFHNNIKGVDRNGWERARKKLIQEADELYAYIKTWKERMESLDKEQLDACRNNFIRGLSNSWIDSKFAEYILNGVLLRQDRRRDIYKREYFDKLRNSVADINLKIKAKIMGTDNDDGFKKPEHVYMGIVDMIEEICREPKFSSMEIDEQNRYDIPL